MNPELESGLREQMTQKQEAFEELIGKVKRRKTPCTNFNDPIT